MSQQTPALLIVGSQQTLALLIVGSQQTPALLIVGSQQTPALLIVGSQQTPALLIVGSQQANLGVGTFSTNIMYVIQMGWSRPGLRILFNSIFLSNQNQSLYSSRIMHQTMD